MGDQEEEPTNRALRERLTLAELVRKRDALGKEIVRSVRRGLAAIPRVSLITTDEDALRFLVPIAYRIFETVKTRFGVPWQRDSIPPNWAAAEGWATAISDEDKRQKRAREEASFAAAQDVVRKSHGEQAAKDSAKVRFAERTLTTQAIENIDRMARPQAWPGATLQELKDEAFAKGIPFRVLRRRLDPKSPKAIALESDLAMVQVFSKSDILADLDRTATASGAIAILRRSERRAAGATDLPGGRRYMERAHPLLIERAAFEAKLPPPNVSDRRKFYARFSGAWEAAELFPAVCPSCGVWYARTDRRTRGCPSCVAGAYQRHRRAEASEKKAKQMEENLQELREQASRHREEEHYGRRNPGCHTCEWLDQMLSEERGMRRRPPTVPGGDLLAAQEMNERTARGGSR
jgi:hypothetical protein